MRVFYQFLLAERGPWCRTVKDDATDWEELNRRYGPLTLLVPDPFAEPVTTFAIGDRVVIEAEVVTDKRLRTIRPGKFGSIGYFDFGDVTAYPHRGTP